MVNYFILKQYIVLFFFPMLALLSHMNKVLASNPPAGWGLPLCRLHVFPASSHRHTHTHTQPLNTRKWVDRLFPMFPRGPSKTSRFLSLPGWNRDSSRDSAMAAFMTGMYSFTVLRFRF